MDKDKQLDDIFKSRLENPDDHSAHMEDDWMAMEKMLDDGKKRPAIIYWLPVLSGVAALLLVLFGIWYLKPVITHPQKPQQTAVNDHKEKNDIAKNEQKNPGKSGGSTQRQAVGQQNILAPANFANNNSSTTKHNNPAIKPFTNSSADGVRRDTTGVIQPNGQNRQANNEMLALNSQPVFDNSIASNQRIDTIDVLIKHNAKTAQQQVKPAIKTSFTRRPQYALTVLAASDLNGVNSLQQSKVGTNVGLLFSAGLFKKLTISSGAIYTSKPYMTNFSNYHTAYQFPTDPVSVQANCRMFDIPLNVDYQLYAKHRNKLSLGTGISSYLMMHESYDFNYASGSTGPGYFNVKNPDKYFFSILNLQATYTRQVNSKFGLSVQPYMKLPLSNIGASQVRLQTTGVAVGLTWNINPLSKP